jgi:membrane-associated protease RseP (regulator of RpoE activity)
VIDEDGLSAPAAKSARKGLEEVGDATSPDAYWRAKTWKRIAVIFAGPGTNLILTLLLLTTFYAISGEPTRVIVSDVTPNTPAAAAGFAEGDRIIAIEGRKVRPLEEPQLLRDTIAEKKGTAFSITLRKADGDLQTLNVTPRRLDKNSDAYRLGFSFAADPDSVRDIGMPAWSSAKGERSCRARSASCRARRRWLSDASSTTSASSL